MRSVRAGGRAGVSRGARGGRPVHLGQAGARAENVIVAALVFALGYCAFRSDPPIILS